MLLVLAIPKTKPRISGVFIADPICIPYNGPQKKALSSAEKRQGCMEYKWDSYTIQE